MSEANSGIYKIMHRDSGRSYIGSAVNFPKRWSLHRKKLERNSHHSRHLQNAWNLYGASAFDFVIVELVPLRAELIRREQAWIDREKAVVSGFNISPTAGSSLGVKHSAETRAKVGAAMRGRKLSAHQIALLSARSKAAGMAQCHTPEVRAKAAAANRGKKRPAAAIEATAASRRGMKFSPEWRARLSAAQRGVKRSPRTAEHRAKLAAAMTGSTHSQEVRDRLSNYGKLRGAPKLTREQIDRGAAKRRGAKRTEEQKARIAVGVQAAYERRICRANSLDGGVQ